MSDKQLQRVTEGVADIGQAAVRRAVLNPRKFFHRVKGGACTSELIGLYDVIARLISIALQHDVSSWKAQRSPRRSQIRCV